MNTLRSIFTFLLFALGVDACAQTINVAVAANLQSVIKELGEDFKTRSGIAVEPIVSSSGKLVAQISNGAPYDVFLSADMDFARKLSDDGFADGKPKVYAKGILIVGTVQDIAINTWRTSILTKEVEKIAIANAKLAPYGRAAEEALTKLDLLDKIRSKLVYGESISQVNTYIVQPAVTLGFTTKSLVKEQQGSMTFHWAEVGPKLYSPIEQGMVVIKKSKNKRAAKKFYDYMLTAPAQEILKKYGYLIP
ncbi:molybdate ABC transporter substrate-binding protein [Mucilaginibacter myungsuensis]|uniref:Molybdate ABC transporter substrate-binding protein n=1 Tax=Mucilaginibacter myungsuensis TaxID=649104 RepID=A0A929KTW5_9SPHI|nr:molybdate ABC transporter substrate-binding protein [Mucilaginibacter myungsuensis]MBE9660328.1 molybdate ABC transporter substrate-binding protein [Mucilaginibacter myungsuensis]MDN3600370.1 molybdate ABC transporter substrate-binding protein [Mucilaginibacter myungsuensis]